ncbi:MAG: CRISPR-associated endonuclease Cas1 [Thermoguttaceae bacterium]|nr:CRISPR-associated endonuclease Cas1 [Thermoguttaceae bacterium]MDW8037574.1 CRISPR-associated endonuclease Cas1 [Thermoguttaceae bacterium]
MTLTDLYPRGQLDVPDLVPVRMLNEFCYCPRLAYLEWVQGEFADNLDTLQGRFDHRRVDGSEAVALPEPLSLGQAESAMSDVKSSASVAAPSGSPPFEPIHARSVLLSAPEEGLIARIDLIELENSTAVPVDYKHGAIPDLPEQAWEPERVQLCAQGLILRANGYHCEGGILYYVQSRRRIGVPFDDALIQRTRQLLRELRQMASSGRIPPPLQDSPKCPRCSLVGICLPDETRLFLSEEAGPSLADVRSLAQDQAALDQVHVRRLIPARDDALPLYLQEQGLTLGKQGDLLVVRRRQETVQQVRMLDISQVCLFGNVQVTTQALRDLCAAGIPICYFSYGGWFYGLTTGLVHKNVELRLAQFRWATHPRRALCLARRFVVGKIKNSRTLIRRHLPDQLGVLQQLAHLARQAAVATDPNSLLGIEGAAAQTYFAAFAKLLKPDTSFNFQARNRRPPRDPVNALLSFLYALLVKELTIGVHTIGFDPMLGFFHRPRYGRPSLALDLAEEFRPLLADSVVLSLINTGQINQDHFIRRAGAVALTDQGRRTVIAAFERRLDSLIRHPLFGYRISYRRILHVQARLLARTLLAEIPRYPNFLTR